MPPATSIIGMGSSSAATNDGGTGSSARGGIWSQILQENARSSSETATSRRHLIVLGARSSGKRTLVARLQRKDRTDMPRGMALEYTHVEATPPGEQQQQHPARLSVWDLNCADPRDHTDLLAFPLDAERIARACFLVVLDMSRPWDIAAELAAWLEAIADASAEALEALDRYHAENEAKRKSTAAQDGTSNSNSNSNSTTFQGADEEDSGRGGEENDEEGYDAEALLAHNVERFRTFAAALRDGEKLPLDSGTLTVNVGVPIIVAVAKCDSMPHLEREYEFKDHHHEYIQYHLRSACLAHGAALVYTSAKDDINVNVLFDHIFRILYGWDESNEAQVLDKASVFVPLGWDSVGRLEVLADTIAASQVDVGAPFAEVIRRPKSRAAAASAVALGGGGSAGNGGMLTAAEDEQSFLKAQLEHATVAGGTARKTYAADRRGAGSSGASASGSSTAASGAAGASSAAAKDGAESSERKGKGSTTGAGSGSSVAGSGADGGARGGANGAGSSKHLPSASAFFASLAKDGKGAAPNRALRRDVKKEMANLLDESNK